MRCDAAYQGAVKRCLACLPACSRLPGLGGASAAGVVCRTGPRPFSPRGPETGRARPEADGDLRDASGPELASRLLVSAVKRGQENHTLVLRAPASIRNDN
ncbi:hypothetical protein NDU88_004971 [Pleurodeles waltl]|uniref:Uncharacterized protein n=1 Tax=Pleurodeles waltl TaxID=8319 RepID=A0AAV7WWL3_PLEWA|nr:hypothetical protein NDU88_004971 [Pleurodeles waltl]